MLIREIQGSTFLIDAGVLMALENHDKLKNDLTSASDELLDLNLQLSQKIQQFIGFIDKFYYPKELTNTMREFYRHEFRDLIGDLEKQGIKVRISDTIEVLELFDLFKKQINNLQESIKQKQQEIDFMVGSIYSGLRNTLKAPDLSDQK